jgi:hypothetical protein
MLVDGDGVIDCVLMDRRPTADLVPVPGRGVPS